MSTAHRKAKVAIYAQRNIAAVANCLEMPDVFPASWAVEMTERARVQLKWANRRAA